MKIKKYILLGASTTILTIGAFSCASDTSERTINTMDENTTSEDTTNEETTTFTGEEMEENEFIVLAGSLTYRNNPNLLLSLTSKFDSSDYSYKIIDCKDDMSVALSTIGQYNDSSCFIVVPFSDISINYNLITIAVNALNKHVIYIDTPIKNISSISKKTYQIRDDYKSRSFIFNEMIEEEVKRNVDKFDLNKDNKIKSLSLDSKEEISNISSKKEEAESFNNLLESFKYDKVKFDCLSKTLDIHDEEFKKDIETILKSINEYETLFIHDMKLFDIVISYLTINGYNIMDGKNINIFYKDGSSLTSASEYIMKNNYHLCSNTIKKVDTLFIMLNNLKNNKNIFSNLDFSTSLLDNMNTTLLFKYEKAKKD